MVGGTREVLEPISSSGPEAFAAPSIPLSSLLVLYDPVRPSSVE